VLKTFLLPQLLHLLVRPHEIRRVHGLRIAFDVDSVEIVEMMHYFLNKGDVLEVFD
jgi:hypothetical protein